MISSCDPARTGTMKKTSTGATVLLLLMLLLAGVLVVRTRHAESTAAQRETTEAEEPISAVREKNNQHTQLPSETEGMETPSPEETADLMPAPDSGQTPEPAATPHPLRPICLTDRDLPEELLLPATHCGTVEEDDYPTRDMVSDVPDRINKDVMVYLPYGYDPEEKYDVLVLLHCAWADHRFWLGQDRNYGTEAQPVPVAVPNLLDRMIEEGYCRPLIVVSPCIYLYDRQPSRAGNGYDYSQFALEFGKDFLPWVVENYATWAADGERENLKAAREHFGVLGASFGAYAAYASVIGDNFDTAAWYTFCGGGEIDPGYLTNAWTQRGTDDLPLKMLYICEGEYDDRAGPEMSYTWLRNAGGAFGEENVRFTLVNGWGHEDHSYLVGLFNTLQMFFRDESAA